ncbi:site-specific integrase [Pseudomonas bohemica]|uniref:site-specific integrase n=1 Tax=Pseudomonas bohemica TaxID=2044872 RepID=UPI000DA61630|nr:site-specific integrase [Pseudomonas bohemica]
MKQVPSYLSRNRHGTYYFRIVIPASIRSIVKGKREIRRSLKTDSQKLALKRARQHAVRYESVFDRVLMMSSQDDYEPSEEDYEIFEQLAKATSSSPQHGVWGSSESDATEPPEILSDAELEARQRRSEVGRLLTGAYGRDIPESLEPLAKRLLASTESYLPTELRKALPRVRDELVRGDVLPATPAQAAQRKAYDPMTSEWTLYQVWEHQLDRDRKNLSSKGGQARHSGTLEERERLARVMTILTRHTPVRKLTKRDWQEAYDAALNVRSGAKASIAPDPTDFDELMTDKPEEMIGHERLSALLSFMKQIQEHARRILDLTDVRPDDLVINNVEKRDSARTREGVPFSQSDVEKIFSGYIYVGALPTNRSKAYPFWFWVPLIGYFTGARTNEIAQLDTADIREIDGLPCIDFCPDAPKSHEAKRIKTGEARHVPIHPKLLELGFLDYVASLRQENQKKLLGDGLSYLPGRDDEADHNKEGWAKAAGKFFNEAPKGYLVEIGVHVPYDGKSIYSFRHTLETNLRNARRDGNPVDQSIIDAITGHVAETIAGKHYDAGATNEQKLKALMHLPIPAAIERLTSYKVDFESRFGEVLVNSIANHRKKRSRTL